MDCSGSGSYSFFATAMDNSGNGVMSGLSTILSTTGSGNLPEVNFAMPHSVATAEAVLNKGQLDSIKLTYGGYGYTRNHNCSCG